MKRHEFLKHQALLLSSYQKISNIGGKIKAGSNNQPKKKKRKKKK